MKWKKSRKHETFHLPATGLEPVQGCPRGILSPLRLPIPPRRHITFRIKFSGLPLTRQSQKTTQKRLELSTSAVTGRRSNQLSHWASLRALDDRILVVYVRYMPNP